MKKTKVYVIFIIVVVIVTYIVLPKNIYQIMGVKIENYDITAVRISHKNGILDGGVQINVTDELQIESIKNFMKRYKYFIIPFKHYKEMDNESFYYFSFKNSEMKEINFTIFNENEILIENYYGYYGMYRATGNGIDMNFVIEYFEKQKNIQQ